MKIIIKNKLKIKSFALLLAAFVLTFMFLALFIFPACSREYEDIDRITLVLDWVPNTNHTGIYVADYKNYYLAEGLEVIIVQPAEGSSADIVAADKAEFGISYQEEVIYALTSAEPLPVAAVAAIIQHNTSGFASPAEKNIKTPADFEGKKYGGWGSPMEDAMLKGLMEKYGADWNKLEIVNIGAADFFISVTRDVDFAWIYYGWTGIAAEIKGFELDFMLLQDIDERLNFYTPVIITNNRLIDEKPEIIEKFLSATAKGYIYSIENPVAAAEILLEKVPELDRDITIASQKYLSGQYMADAGRWGEMDIKVWDTFSDWMYENGLLNMRLDSGKAFTNDFLP